VIDHPKLCCLLLLLLLLLFLQVGYCQGMAFAVGVLLMFVPEEPAFR
jgi:hypothetical protein